MTAQGEIVAILRSLDYEHSDLASQRLIHPGGEPFTPDESARFYEVAAEVLREFPAKIAAGYARAIREITKAIPNMTPDDQREAKQMLRRIRLAAPPSDDTRGRTP